MSIKISKLKVYGRYTIGYLFIVSLFLALLTIMKYNGALNDEHHPMNNRIEETKEFLITGSIIFIIIGLVILFFKFILIPIVSWAFAERDSRDDDD